MAVVTVEFILVGKAMRHNYSSHSSYSGYSSYRYSSYSRATAEPTVELQQLQQSYNDTWDLASAQGTTVPASAAVV